MNPDRLTPIAIAVVEQAGQLLIGQRPVGVPLAGFWEFPGGKIEAGECPEEAAVRECMEETGVAVRAIEICLSHRQDYEHDRLQLHFVRCQPLESPPLPQPPYRWVDRAALPQYRFPAGNQILLRQLALCADDERNNYSA